MQGNNGDDVEGTYQLGINSSQKWFEIEYG